MSPSSPFAVLLAQAATAAPDVSAAAGQQPPFWTSLIVPLLIMLMVYFALIRPQMQAKKKAEETVKSAKTGDKIVTTSGIHGTITNVKDSTVVVRIADNVKIELEKSHIDKITRESAPVPEKAPAAKA
ncbi:MAG: preprotein translocase subunit YajC [Verrucomicrobiota bacterium]